MNKVEQKNEVFIRNIMENIGEIVDFYQKLAYLREFEKDSERRTQVDL
ncbi:MAG: hypothetical protein K0Q51_508 [Rickettsiaceae bacterium]|jgi:hypothetical protein|nr:hypothetical protein [Rickettsiaceae bacterium]